MSYEIMTKFGPVSEEEYRVLRQTPRGFATGMTAARFQSITGRNPIGEGVHVQLQLTAAMDEFYREGWESRKRLLTKLQDLALQIEASLHIEQSATADPE